MPIINGDGTPLLEFGPVTFFRAHGVDHLEVIGPDVNIIYFYWRKMDGVFRRVMADCACVMPVAALTTPLAQWPNVSVMGPDGDMGARLHS